MELPIKTRESLEAVERFKLPKLNEDKDKPEQKFSYYIDVEESTKGKNSYSKWNLKGKTLLYSKKAD